MVDIDKSDEAELLRFVEQHVRKQKADIEKNGGDLSKHDLTADAFKAARKDGFDSGVIRNLWQNGDLTHLDKIILGEDEMVESLNGLAKALLEDFYGNKDPVINGKKVDTGSLELDGIDTKDYPDFADAYVAAASFEDGTPLTDDELQELHDKFPDFVYNKVVDSLNEDGKEIEEAKSKVQQQFDYNEDNNYHTENALLLAKHFGTPDEVAAVKAALVHRNNHGGYGQNGAHHIDTVDLMHRKYGHKIKMKDAQDIVDEAGVLKSIKRGLKGWDGKGHVQDIKDQTKNSSDHTLITLAKTEKETPPEGSPRNLQTKLINRELKKRYGVEEDMVDEAGDAYDRDLDNQANRYWGGGQTAEWIEMIKDELGEKKEELSKNNDATDEDFKYMVIDAAFKSLKSKLGHKLKNDADEDKLSDLVSDVADEYPWTHDDEMMEHMKVLSGLKKKI